MKSRNMPVRVGLIGLGNMGQNHLRVLSMLKGVDLVFVYDLNVDVAERMAALHQTKTSSDLDSLLPLADAVVICTPTVTHGDFLRKSADYLNNIFVEKPLSHSLDQSRDLVEFIEARRANIQVGFIERFNPAVEQLKSVIGESEGVISIDFTRTNKLSARITDVDVITDLMIHDIDLALYLNGPVAFVSAHGLADGGMINFASALLTHKNGRFSRIQASRITEKKIRNIQATCYDMFVDCDLLRKELLVHRQSEIQQANGGPYTISSIEQSIEVRPQEALLSELQTFIALCKGDECKRPDAEDALEAAIICDQIQRAVLK